MPSIIFTMICRPNPSYTSSSPSSTPSYLPVFECSHPEHSGNFSEITTKILSRITPDQLENKLTFLFNQHTFNFKLHTPDSLQTQLVNASRSYHPSSSSPSSSASSPTLFMCMCDDAFGRTAPFLFLQDLIDTYLRLTTSSLDGSTIAALEGATLRAFKAVVIQKMQTHSEQQQQTSTSSFSSSSPSSSSFSSSSSPSQQNGSSNGISNSRDGNSSSNNTAPDKAVTVKRELEDVKGILLNNIDKVISRGEAIDSLVDRTDQLNMNAEQFKRASKKLKENMCWAHIKVKLMIGGIVIGIVYLATASFCGITLSKC